MNMYLLDKLLKKKKAMNWQEVAREPDERMAKIVKNYWNASGMKSEIKKRQDGKWSVFILQAGQEM